MSEITYGVVEETYTVDGHTRTSYGIAAYADAESEGTATVVASVRDITSDRDAADALVKTCNHAQLSPAHLDDVVDDFMMM